MITIDKIPAEYYEISAASATAFDAIGQQVYRFHPLVGPDKYFYTAACPTCGKPTEKPGALCKTCLPI